MENLKAIKEKLTASMSILQKLFFVKEIGVFGSFAAGTQKESSDIDILVSFEKGHNDYFNYSRCKDYLEKLLSRHIDLVPRNAIKTEIKDNILKEITYA